MMQQAWGRRAWAACCHVASALQRRGCEPVLHLCCFDHRPTHCAVQAIAQLQVRGGM
jgi:hypothetical protein